MEFILAEVAVSMSEFKRNPAAVLREANHHPVAVLNDDRAAFYMNRPRFLDTNRLVRNPVLNLLGKESAAVALSGRAAPNPCEPDRKASLYGHRPWTIKRFFALIGRRN